VRSKIADFYDFFTINDRHYHVNSSLKYFWHFFISFNYCLTRYVFVLYATDNSLKNSIKLIYFQCLILGYIKQLMNNVFIRAMVKIFSFGERCHFPFHSAVASWNGIFHLSLNENIFTIARMKTFIVCIYHTTPQHTAQPYH
jgi:hypothetical protein